MADNARLLLLEASDGDGGLRVTEVDEGDNSLLFLGQVCLSEETIVVADCSALADDTEALEASDIASIDKSLTLGVRGV